MDWLYLFQFISIKVSSSHVVCMYVRDKRQRNVLKLSPVTYLHMGWVEKTNQIAEDFKGFRDMYLPLCVMRAHCARTLNSKSQILHAIITTTHRQQQKQIKHLLFFFVDATSSVSMRIHSNSLQDLYFISENRKHEIFFVEISIFFFCQSAMGIICELRTN